MAAAGLYILQNIKHQHGIFQEGKEEGKDQELIQSSTTSNLGYHMESDKNTENITYKRVG